MKNDRNKINNGKKWNNEDGKKHIVSFPFPFICYPYMLMINIKRNQPLTYKIKEKPSNQQKQTTKPFNKKLGEINKNEKW